MQPRTLFQVSAAFLTMAGCTTARPPIERIRTVDVVTQVAAPCPLPADVRPMPAKPVETLPDDARAALAVVTRWALDLTSWGRVVEAQQSACSGL
jgi:hypothetical protein